MYNIYFFEYRSWITVISYQVLSNSIGKKCRALARYTKLTDK